MLIFKRSYCKNIGRTSKNLVWTKTVIRGTLDYFVLNIISAIIAQLRIVLHFAPV